MLEPIAFAELASNIADEARNVAMPILERIAGRTARSQQSLQGENRSANSGEPLATPVPCGGENTHRIQMHRLSVPPHNLLVAIVWNEILRERLIEDAGPMGENPSVDGNVHPRKIELIAPVRHKLHDLALPTSQAALKNSPKPSIDTTTASWNGETWV